MERVNLVDILRDAPKGLHLYCTMLGDVSFSFIEEGNDYPICVQSEFREETYLTPSGAYFFNDGKHGAVYDILPCVLFPDKDHQTWENWQTILFASGDIITGPEGTFEFSEEFFINNGNMMHYLKDNKGEGHYIKVYPDYQYATPCEKGSYIASLSKFSKAAKQGCPPIVNDYPEIVFKADNYYVVRESFRHDSGATFIEGDICYCPADNCIRTISGQLVEWKEKTKLFKKWSVNNATQGDILVAIDEQDETNRRPFIFKFVNMTVTGELNVLAYCITNVKKEFSKIEKDFMGGLSVDGKILPASPDDITLMNEALAENGLMFDSNVLEFKAIKKTPIEKDNEKSTKFNPFTLQPFDKVIVRDVSKSGIWRPNFFSHIADVSYNKYCCIGGHWYSHCIPYNEETMKMIGTTGEPDEFYQY